MKRMVDGLLPLVMILTCSVLNQLFSWCCRVRVNSFCLFILIWVFYKIKRLGERRVVVEGCAVGGKYL